MKVTSHQVCGLNDITPGKFGQVNTLVTHAKNYGRQFEHYNGVNVSVNAHLPGRGVMQGGLNVERTEANNCARWCRVIHSWARASSSRASALLLARPFLPPRRYCDTKVPFQPQVKLLSTHPLRC